MALSNIQIHIYIFSKLLSFLKEPPKFWNQIELVAILASDYAALYQRHLVLFGIATPDAHGHTEDATINPRDKFVKNILLI